MKKALFSLFLLILIFSSVEAQEKSESRIHAFSTYGLRTDQFGFGGGLEYFFAENFALMPSFTRLGPRVGNATNFSFDLRYYLSEGVSQIFVLAGYSQTFENTQPGTAGTRRNFVGGNVGVGGFIRITDWVGLISEFRFQSQGIREGNLKVGLAFPL